MNLWNAATVTRGVTRARDERTLGAGSSSTKAWRFFRGFRTFVSRFEAARQLCAKSNAHRLTFQ